MKWWMLGTVVLVLFVTFAAAGMWQLSPQMTGKITQGIIQEGGLLAKLLQKPVPLIVNATLILEIADNDGGFEGQGVDANIIVRNASGDVVVSIGTRGRKVIILENIIPGDGNKDRPSHEVEINSPDYWIETRALSLLPGEEHIERIWLSRKKMDMSECSDSDEGTFSLVRGTTTYTRIQRLGPEVVKNDTCNGSQLIEYYCGWDNDGLSVQNVTFDCPDKCRNGACIVDPYCVDGVCIPLENASCSTESGYDANLFIGGGVRLYEQIWQHHFENPPPVLEKIPGKIAGNAIAEAQPVPAAGAGGEGADKEVPRDDFPFREPKHIFQSDACNDEKQVLKYSCRGIAGERDDSRIPQLMTFTCPDDYHCAKDGRCIENKRVFPELRGDVNGDRRVDQHDAQALRTLINANNAPYWPDGDFDDDGMTDAYDVYRLEKYLSHELPADSTLPVRFLKIDTQGKSIFSPDYISGPITEFKEDGRIKTYKSEYKQKGHSRSSCIPPELNVKFKKKDLFFGMSSFAGLQTLGYQRVRFVPDCDILRRHEADNQLREYVLYSTYRSAGIPVNDILGFARVNFSVPDSDNFIDQTKSHQYMLLQRDDEDNDQISFMKQFGFSSIIQDNDSSRYNSLDEKSDRVTQVVVSSYQINQPLVEVGKGTAPTQNEMILHLDPDTTLRNRLLESFFTLGDRGILHNEYYGLDATTGMWKPIPTDMDSSLDGCGFNDAWSSISSDMDNLNPSKEQKAMYATKTYARARELFDNPETLYRMLAAVDRYPFDDNKIKVKNTLRWQFYATGLYYGSKEFADELNVPYVPFAHHDEYVHEGKRILAATKYLTLCEGDNYDLEAFARLVGDAPKKDDSSSSGGIAIPIPPAPGIAMPVPKKP